MLENKEAVEYIFRSNSLLFKKNELIGQLRPLQLPQIKQAVPQLQSVLEHEEHLWNSMVFDSKTQTTKERPLSDSEKALVQAHANAVRQICGDTFTSLEEYAIISDTCYYKNAYADFCKFKEALTFKTHKTDLFEKIAQQQKIIMRMNALSHVSSHVTDLKLALEDQKVILSRFPHISFEIDSFCSHIFPNKHL